MQVVSVESQAELRECAFSTGGSFNAEKQITLSPF